MVGLGPFCVCTTIGYIGGKHCTKIGHLLATIALGETFGIDGTLLCLRIEKLTPGVQIDNKQTPIHGLFMAAEPTLGTFALPRGCVTDATHGALLQRDALAGSARLGVWEEGWREQ